MYEMAISWPNDVEHNFAKSIWEQTNKYSRGRHGTSLLEAAPGDRERSGGGERCCCIRASKKVHVRGWNHEKPTTNNVSFDI